MKKENVKVIKTTSIKSDRYGDLSITLLSDGRVDVKSSKYGDMELHVLSDGRVILIGKGAITIESNHPFI